MDKEIKECIYRNFRITVYLNIPVEKGIYRAGAKKLFGQPIVRENALKIPNYSAHGNDPDELIEQLKSDLDRDLKNA